MNWVHLVIGLALLQFFVFCMAVGRARATYKVDAPATTGNEVFERYFRVQMNTMEQLLIFVPSILIFASYVSPRWAAGLGALYLIGRIMYFRGYVKAPVKRSFGFLVSALPNLTLLVGGIAGVIVAMARHS
jgi:glutathione S-transferase